MRNRETQWMHTGALSPTGSSFKPKPNYSSTSPGSVFRALAHQSTLNIADCLPSNAYPLSCLIPDGHPDVPRACRSLPRPWGSADAPQRQLKRRAQLSVNPMGLSYLLFVSVPLEHSGPLHLHRRAV